MNTNDKKVIITKFNEMSKYISCSEIPENNRALKSFHIEGKDYIITGGIGTGTKSGGWGSLWGIEMIPLQLYKNSLKPLKYNDHLHLVLNGKRERGYNGVIIQCEGKEVVLIGETIFFTPEKKEVQISLWDLNNQES